MEQLLWRLLPVLALLLSFIVLFNLQDPYKAQLSSHIKLNLQGGDDEFECSLLPHNHYWISSKRILTPQGFISGSVEINEGKIVSIVEGYSKKGSSVQEVIHYGEAVVMPGLIDVRCNYSG